MVPMLEWFYLFIFTIWQILTESKIAKYDAPSGEKDKYLKSEIHFIEF